MKLTSGLLILILLSACSFNKDLSYEDAYDGHPSEKSSSDYEKDKKEAEELELFGDDEDDDEDFLAEDDGEVEDLLAEDEDEDLLADDDGDEVDLDEDFLDDDGEDELLIVDEEVEESTTPEISSGEYAEYTVNKGETLMMIAFKIYGDFGRWRELAQVNSLSGSRISTGFSLKYERPSEEFSWQPEGEPYLIVNGDTLGKISSKTYGVPKYWEYIWNNNRPLIKDPNKIYAGFTIFTLPLDEEKKRGVSSL